MEIQKWLRRKYPHFYKMINVIFIERVIKEYLKDYKYELAILRKEVGGDYRYNVGTIFLVKKIGSMNDSGIWDGTYIIHSVFYCGKSITASGYHHTYVYSEDYFEILKDRAE